MTQGHDVISPTTAPFAGSRGMTDDEVRGLVDAYACATELSLEAGLDGVEIHGANGWLVQQFFSSNTNLRTDDWGGSREKRMALPLVVVDAVDAVRRRHDRPDFIVGYRFSSEEPGERGLTIAAPSPWSTPCWTSRGGICTCPCGTSTRRRVGVRTPP
ncbi:hypothetical protein [Actinomyces ruminis]|uniref:oxidoreductase n=1 Tax=Actinomyces ruminis TaxID=1937003 RepID=UPI000B684BB5